MKKLKFIADENIEKPLVDLLLAEGHDVLWIHMHKRQLSDEDILLLSNKEKRIILTNDKDFGELVFLQKKLSTGIILLRFAGQETMDKIAAVRNLLEKHYDKLLHRFVILTKRKVRFIPLEVCHDRKSIAQKSHN